MDRVRWWLALDVQLDNNNVIINIIPTYSRGDTHVIVLVAEDEGAGGAGANRYRIMVDKYVLCMFPQGKICYSNRT